MVTQSEHPTLALCRELIQRASVTPVDAGCQDLMMRRLQAVGFTCQRLPFGDTVNFWAERGSSGPLLAFAGHTDVVPTGPESAWRTPPFEPTDIDGVLYGRGAADMKGSLAAMVIACEDFVREQPDHSGRIGFLITSDEEGPATDGTVRVMQWLRESGRHIDWALVGEPSSSTELGDTVKNGRRGSLGATLVVRGRQGHVAYPQLADNPVHRALPALAELAGEHWDSGNAHFPATSLQISNIQAGTGATNVIPGELRVLFNFRFSTETTADKLRRRTEELLNRHGLDYHIDWNLSGEPFLTAEGPLVEATVAAIREVTGRTATLSTAGGTSDGRFIAPYGAQIVELGPVNASIHQVNEHVRSEDLVTLTQIYAALLRRLLAK
ncbi:MAG: succinyl-diaminopimelate desuccinylase [Chromatocurvus sp.]